MLVANSSTTNESSSAGWPGVVSAGSRVRLSANRPARPDNRAAAADRAGENGRAGVSVRCVPAEDAVIDRGHGRGRKAEQETVERRVVTIAAPGRPLFLAGGAEDAGGMQVTHRQIGSASCRGRAE